MNLSLLVEDGDTFVDVGANVGLYACTVARRLRLRPGRNLVYAFEPNPDTFRRLERSAVPLGVRAVRCAVSDRAGVLEFVCGAVSNVFTAVEHAAGCHFPNERVTVNCRRLDEMELEGSAFIIKIDVEGHEVNVLQGAVRLFEAGSVKAVYIDGYENPAVEGFLRAHGFEFLDGLTLESIPGGRFNLLAVKAS
jgi:FkbM family methyltransferase